MLTQKKALTILFLEGLASSAVQMLAIRQTMPYAGNSVLNTSIIIGFFLASLAIGYFIGGHVPMGKYREKLTRNLVLSIGIFGLGLSSPFVEVFFFSVGQVVPHPLLQLTIYCAVIVAPLVILLAQTVPLLVNAMKAERKAQASGNAYSMSTIGNVIGALVTSLVIMYFLGTGYAVAINCAVLWVCLLLLTPKYWAGKLGAAIVVLFTSGINVFANNLVLSSNAYSDINIKPYEDGQALIVNQSLASFYNNKGQGWPYIEVLKRRLLSKEPGRVWVLGAGGFTLSINDTKHDFTYVDIDPALQQIAEDHLIKQPINGEFVASDARLFLKQATYNVDYIVIDLYANAITIPAHTATLEFHAQVNDKLTDDGEVMLNIIANNQLGDAFSVRMDATIRQAYGNCLSHIVQFDQALANILYFCDKKYAKQSPRVFSDNNTQVSVLSHLSAITQFNN